MVSLDQRFFLSLQSLFQVRPGPSATNNCPEMSVLPTRDSKMLKLPGVLVALKRAVEAGFVVERELSSPPSENVNVVRESNRRSCLCRGAGRLTRRGTN